MRLHSYFYQGVLGFFLLVGQAHAEPLTIAIAANLKYVFDDLAIAFKKETGIETQSVLNASGKIATQVRQGAPFDVFMSADMDFPEGLYKDGFADAPPKPYAYGLLVLWSQTGADLSKGIPGLVDPAISKVAIANPKVAPFGKQALNALAYFNVKAAVEPKLVYGESITQVSQYVDSMAVDVGLTAKSIVVAPETAGKKRWVAVPEDSYAPIAQGVVILKHGLDTHADAARKFYGFLQSETARNIFAKNGYKLP